MRRRITRDDVVAPRLTRRRARGRFTAEPLRDDAPFAISGSLARLPWQVIGETIFGFLAPPPAFQVRQPNGLNINNFQAQLVPFQLVCSHWHRATLTLVEEFKRKVDSLDFTTSNRKANNAPGREPQGERHVIQLQCIALYPKKPMRPLILQSALPPDRLVRIVWRSELSPFPYILRLDLLNVCLSLVQDVLPVAAAHCVQVQYLILPQKQTSWTRGVVPYERLTGQLVEALRAWFTSNGGLRGLCIPEWPSEPHGRYDVLLSAVAECCPRLEFLRGWHTENSIVPLTARHLGNVHVAVWELFCTKCTMLCEFSWLLAPMTSSFVDKFRQPIKPRLAHLNIDDSVPTVDCADIAALASLFPALPALTKLSLWMPNYGKLSSRSDHSQGGTLNELIRSVVSNCPSLESFRCFFPRALERTALASGEALADLIASQAVNDVEISPVELSSTSLVKIIQVVIERNKQRLCRVQLHAVGSSDKAIHELLRSLASQDKRSLESIRLHLAVETPDGDGGGDRSSMTAAEVKARIDAVKDRFASIVGQITPHRLDEGFDGPLSGIQLCINS